ncbi:hypothetical protein OBP_203 [Pseudomonas phage OBP]|uniref:hypothetical protein n=1 Tax=Pseudomonas phage OBP TaxID=1124849 RepID=UPI000240D5AB|nr:hypothetical protein OBP_203 [Pseudomonas phage OBP]AEV89640.1 hypothetical protein OBP_203 [Pseudomonas phage OBP]
MANKVTLLQGQTVMFQVTALFEGKNAVDKTMTLNDQVDFKDLVEGAGGDINEDGKHIDLHIKGIATGTNTIVVPFGYDGHEEGVEGEDISTLSIEVEVSPPDFKMDSTEPIERFDKAVEYTIPFTLWNGTERIDLNSLDLGIVDSSGIINITGKTASELKFKISPDFNPNPGESISGNLKFNYYDAQLTVVYTFVLPPVLTATPSSIDVKLGDTGAFPLVLTNYNGTNVTASAKNITASDEYINFTPETGAWEVINDSVEAVSREVTFSYEYTVLGVTWNLTSTITYNIAKQVVRTLSATLESGSLNTFTVGERKITIVDQDGVPATDVTFVSAVTTPVVSGNTNVYDSIATRLNPVTPASGVYAFDYSSKFAGGKISVVFKVKSGNKEYTLNPVVVNFTPEPLSTVVTPANVPKGATSASLQITVNQKRTKNGSPTPITGSGSINTSSGATVFLDVPWSDPYRIRTMGLFNIPTTGFLAYLAQLNFKESENNGPAQDVIIQVGIDS